MSEKDVKERMERSYDEKVVLKARCANPVCGAIYSINPTNPKDVDLRIRNKLIPKIYCAKCGNETFELYFERA